MAYDEILYATSNSLGIITLNNPGKINALSRRMIAEISSALRQAAADENVKVLIIKAAGNAQFATPGVKIGLFCTTPMIALTRAIGRKAAMEMLLTGRYVDAEEARGLGLINRVVSLDSLEA